MMMTPAQKRGPLSSSIATAAATGSMIMIRSKLLRGAAAIGLYLLLLVSSSAEGALLGSSSLSLLRGGGNGDNKNGSGASAGHEAAALPSEGAPADEKVADKSTNRHHRHRDLQTTAKIVGDNGVPSSAFPLGECEGDCDKDSDC
jgi:hypothetical protein